MEKSRSNIVKFPLIIGFLLILILPILNSSLGIWKFDRASENRTFKDSLNFDVNHLDLFPAEAEEYMNDNFSFRTPLLDLFHQMKFYVFNASPHPDKVTIGKNGWYFMADSEQENYIGKNNFNEDTLSLFLDEWKRRKKYFDKKGIKAYWMIAPTAHHVYSEQLPFNIKPSEERRVTQLKNHFEKDYPDLILDPLEILLKNKKNGRLYYKQDNHWTFRGGLYASKLVVNQLRHDFPNNSIPIAQKNEWKDSLEFNGIHHKVLGIKTNGEIRQRPVFQSKNSEEVGKYNFPVVDGFIYSWDFEHRFINEKIKDGLKIVVIRDSFGEQVIPFMTESFSESVFIFDAWQYKLNENIIDTVQPDVVLFITLETHLENLLTSY